MSAASFHNTARAAQRSLALPLTVLVLALGRASTSFAQTATSSDADNGTLEVVVVTAEKRPEDAQKTPIAIATASDDELIREGAEQLQNLERVIPSVILDRQGPGMTVDIRGVVTPDNSPTSEASNAVNVNGAYLAKTTGMDGFLYDIERIEVAEGPQGTLYGRNANGGTLNIITNKPVLDQKLLEGSIEYGSYNRLVTSGVINMALADTLAVRGAFQTLSHSGYMKSGLDDADQKSGRMSILWKPDERQSLWIIADTAVIGGRGSSTAVIREEPLVAGNTASYYIPRDPRDDLFYTTAIDPSTGMRLPSSDTSPFQFDSLNDGLTAQDDYDFDGATWTTELAWRKFNSNPWWLCCVGSGPIDAANGFPTAGQIYSPQHFTSESLETRLSSTSVRPWQWVIGLYGFHDLDGGDFTAFGDQLRTMPFLQYHSGREDANSYAGFGQLVYTPSNLDALHLTVGGRDTGDHKNERGIFEAFGTPGQPGYTVYTVPPVEKTWTAFTYRAGVSYDLTASSLLYGSVSTGSKAGGFASGPGINPAAGPVYSPEKITAFEIGSKNRFLDDTLQLNLEAWEYKYRDYQANLGFFAINQPPVPILTVASAGRATYQGATIDLQYAPTKTDLFKMNFSALGARYNNYVVPTPPGYSPFPCPTGCTPGPVLFDDSNTPITTVPTSTGLASYAHFWTLTRGSLRGELSTNYKGKTLLDLESDPIFGQVRFYQSAFAMFNTSLRYESPDSGWSLMGYINNIGNATKLRDGAYSSGLFTGTLYDPRIIGVVFSVKVM